LQLYQRTADIFLGVPFNIASYALLLLVAAKVTGYEPGEFIHTFGDVHIYENHIDAAREQLAREPTPLPTVSVDADLNTIDDFQPEQVVREGYDPHPSIKADLVVSGGYSEHLHAGRHQHGTNT
jgi:thymidylate synthase